MPTTTQILDDLTAAANQAIPIAIAWHVVLALILLTVVLGRRPAIGSAMMLSAALLLSVAVIAYTTDNPFNAILFALLAVLAAAFALTVPRRPMRTGPDWMSALGIAMMAIGWTYPHFLDGNPALYLIAAPLGVVPCATLYMIVGITLVGGGLRHRAWTLALAVLTVAYGVIGVARLGVYLDIFLVAGAAGLVVAALRHRPRRARPGFSGYATTGSFGSR